MADAMLTPGTLAIADWIRAARGEAKSRFHHFTGRPAAGRTATIARHKAAWLGRLLHAFRSGKRVVVACGTRSMAVEASSALQIVAEECRRTQGRDPRVVQVLSSNDMPADRHVNEAWKVEALVYSPCVSAGVSFSVRGWFDECFLYLVGGFHGLPGVRNQV